MSIKSCAVTGHRKIPADKIEYVKNELRKEIMFALNDGYTDFISGFADGVDLYFAEIVAELKMDNSEISLEAAIPYRGRVNTPNKLFQTLLKQCTAVTIYSDVYCPTCFHMRNTGMVDEAERVIAVYDGRAKGGTTSTIKYARMKNRDLRIINI